MTPNIPIDLRSDTVTRPCAGMRRAIAEAVVGDDVHGDDPTVIALEARVSELLGMEAAMFVPSGTMSNLVALASVADPGDEVLLDRGSHIFNNETASASALAGLQLHPIDGDGGAPDAAQLEPYLRAGDLHSPRTRVIAVENTHNRGGGRVFPIDRLRDIRALADAHGVHVHLDGARLTNAVVATGIAFRQWTSCCDSVSMCFSKGLGAPVGSAVAGTKYLIARARRKRKQLGGGMRQVGILAAAALFALEHHVDRLHVDHDNARRLAEIISSVEGLEVTHPIDTNIVIFRVDEKLHGGSGRFLQRLREAGVHAGVSSPGLVRMVTHHDISQEDVTRVGEVMSLLGA